MFVLKSGAGFSIFKWIAFLASDFLEQALQGAAFFFSDDVVNNHWFFVNTVRIPGEPRSGEQTPLIPVFFSSSRPSSSSSPSCR